MSASLCRMTLLDRVNRKLRTLVKGLSSLLLTHPWALKLFPFMRAYRVSPLNPNSSIQSTIYSPTANILQAPIQMLGEDHVGSVVVTGNASGYHRLQNALVCHNPRYAAAVQEDYFLIPHRLGTGPWQLMKGGDSPIEGRVLAQREDFIAIAAGGVKGDLSEAVFIGSRSPNVWAHWLINFVATAYYAETRFPHLRELPLLIPEGFLDSRSREESLRTIIGDRKTVALRRNQYTRVRNLYWVEAPVYDTPLSLDPVDRSPLSVDKDAMNDFAEFVLARAQSIPVSLGAREMKRIFIARSETDSRAYNQEQIIEVAAKYGFFPVWPQQFGFLEQVNLFANATHIIGPLGSGLAGIAFCKRDTQILCWSNELKVTENYLANLAEVRGSSLLHFLVNGHSVTKGFFSDYALDPDFFEQKLNLFLSGG